MARRADCSLQSGYKERLHIWRDCRIFAKEYVKCPKRHRWKNEAIGLHSGNGVGLQFADGLNVAMCGSEQ